MSNPLIATLDIETDPFLYNRRPEPFAIGLYLPDDKYVSFWGDGCIERMKLYIEQLPPHIIYLHNGGRFDVLGYLMRWVLGHPMRVINNRIVKCHMPSLRDGFHELRDSYSIIPMRLGDFKGKSTKLDICIGKLENNECWDIATKSRSTSRLVYRTEIEEYLRVDCVTLYELVTSFIDLYGMQLTIGTTAMKELKKIHDFEMLPKQKDSEIRSLYFYGGRVDCLQSGMLRGDFKLYDVNSMYPLVMSEYEHPIGAESSVGKRITDETCFVTCEGYNYRAFPTRLKDGGLDYTKTFGRFHVSIHEYNAATRLGIFETTKIVMCFNWPRRGSFRTFVHKFYGLRNDHKAGGDLVRAQLYKGVLVNAYGKFAQSPDNYKEYAVTEGGVSMDHPWRLSSLVDMNGQPENSFMVWTKPSLDTSRFNVATGASITGAARSVLMQAIATSTNPIYCDTDSLVCEFLDADKDASKLGSWKLEATIDECCIAGKKLYAFFLNGKCIKKAHKGFKITGEDIRKVCEGQEVTSYNDAPTFKLDGGHTFVKRTVRMTV